MDFEFILDFRSYSIQQVHYRVQNHGLQKISLYHHHNSSLFLKIKSFSMDKSSFYGAKNLAYDIYPKFEIVCLQIGL